MIYGSGLLATALMSHGMPSGAHFFCKGVSSSRELDPNCYSRELRELSEVLESDTKPVYYFSSVAVTKLKDNSVYYAHKYRTEKLVLATGRGRIVRLPQVVGKSGNRDNLLNFFIDSLLSGSKLMLNRLAVRNFVKSTDIARVLSSFHDDDRLWHSNGDILELSSPFNFNAIKIAKLIAQRLEVECLYETYESDEGVIYDPEFFNRAISEYNTVSSDQYFMNIIDEIMYA